VSDSKRRESQPTIGRHAQDRIGRELRAMYGDLVEQPLPDEVSALLGALDDFETARQRLNQSVQTLRASAAVAVPARPFGLSVHAQQMLIAQAMLNGPAPSSRPRRRRRATGTSG
jgi:Anti-sigma factor NepR